MHRRMWFGVVSMLVVSASRLFAEAPPSPAHALEHVAEVIAHSFPDIPHVTPQTLANLLQKSDATLVLLDVRNADEFAVSHIADAIRIDPTAKNTTSIVAAVGSLEGKTVVAYCSIGLRSARLMARIGQSLKDRGAVKFYNLRGGVFQWRNEQRALVANSRPTGRIHPYSTAWRQYLAEEP